MCSTVVYDYLLTAVFLVSPPFVSRTSDRRVSTYTEISGALYLAFSLPAKLPYPHPALFGKRAASRNGKGAYLRRCAHITPADKLASLSSCLCLSSSAFFLPFPISPSLILLYFSCNLGEVLQGSSSNRPPSRAMSTISGWVREQERLDLAAISLSATLSRLDCRDTSIVVQYHSFCLLRTFKIDCYLNQ